MTACTSRAKRRRDGGVCGQFGADELHGAGPLQQPVFSEPDFPHGALAEFPLQRVLVDLLGPPLGLEGPPLEGDAREAAKIAMAAGNVRQSAL